MKQDTLEGKAKTKNGVKRLCFSIICILLEVIFIITIVTRLNEYAEVINLFTRILSGILVLWRLAARMGERNFGTADFSVGYLGYFDNSILAAADGDGVLMGNLT